MWMMLLLLLLLLIHSCIHFERHDLNRSNTVQLFPFKYTDTHKHTCISIDTRVQHPPTNRKTDNGTLAMVNLNPKDWKHSVADCCRVMLCMRWCSTRVSLSFHISLIHSLASSHSKNRVRYRTTNSIVSRSVDVIQDGCSSSVRLVYSNKIQICSE